VDTAGGVTATVVGAPEVTVRAVLSLAHAASPAAVTARHPIVHRILRIHGV
jgi:hypothetical protein